MTPCERFVCRCEEVTAEDVTAAVKGGAATPRELKLRTRVGMGACQGRTCRSILYRLLGSAAGPEDLTVRPPIRLVLVDDVLKPPIAEAKGNGR